MGWLVKETIGVQSGCSSYLSYWFENLNWHTLSYAGFATVCHRIQAAWISSCPTSAQQEYQSSIKTAAQKSSPLVIAGGDIISIIIGFLPCNICLTPIWSSGKDSWFSPRRPGFDSRYGNDYLLFISFVSSVRVRGSFSFYFICPM